GFPPTLTSFHRNAQDLADSLGVGFSYHFRRRTPCREGLLASMLDAHHVADARPAPYTVAVPPSQSLPQIPALTGLRFFAAFFILFAHAVDWLAQFQNSNIRQNFSFVAMYGMPLFFVLSGFVIHYN